MRHLHICFNETATTEIYTLSLHDALPICRDALLHADGARALAGRERRGADEVDGQHDLATCGLRLLEDAPRRVVHLGFLQRDRKSTRLNSSHANISYAVFCLKTKTAPNNC